MKWEPSDLIVGSVLLAAVAILVGVLVWISPTGAKHSFPVYAHFERVDGIAEKSPVQLGGFTVGRVEAIEPQVTPEGSLTFRLRLNVTRRFASGDILVLPEGTVARLVPPPVPVGPGVIALELPAVPGAALSAGAVIPGIRSVSMLEQAQTLTESMGAELLQTVAGTRVLLDSLSHTVALANSTLDIAHVALPTIVRTVEADLTAVRALTHDLQLHLGAMLPAAAASLDSVNVLVDDSRRLVRDLSVQFRAHEPTLETMIANLDSTTLLLHHFVRQVTRQPWRAVTGVRPPPQPAQPVGDPQPEIP